MFSIPFLMGSPSEGASPQGSFVQIGMIVAVFAIFWLLIIRPQRKKQRDAKNMIAAMKKGDYVTSIGGIRGTIKTVNEESVIVEVDKKGSTLEFSKSAIGSVQTASVDAPKSKAVKEETESSDDK